MKLKPAQVELKAPPRLLNTFAALGYEAKLVLTRAEVATVDPGSDPGPVDAPVTHDEMARLRATLAAYAVNDKPDKGAKFKAPSK